MRFNNGFKINTSRKQFKAPKEKGERRLKLKWWHILLIVLGVLIIAAAITVGIIIGNLNNMPGSDLENIETQGTITSVGTFAPSDTDAYILCEYTEHFSGEKTVLLQKPADIRFDYKAYYVFYAENGEPFYDISGEYTGEKTPEALKAEILADVQSRYQYSDENIARCDVKIFTPVAFTELKISELTMKNGNATLKYQAGALGGELSEEYTLSGTYTKTGDDFAFTYTNLPEDAHLRRVAEKVLASAKYDYYEKYGVWANRLTIGGTYELFLQAEAE